MFVTFSVAGGASRHNDEAGGVDDDEQDEPGDKPDYV